MGRSGSQKRRAGVDPPGGVSAPRTPAPARDYDALWKSRYARALRQGMTTGMARYVARVEVHDQQLADRGLQNVGSGDLELVY